VCTLLKKKNLSTDIRFEQVILKGFLRLDLLPVQLVFPIDHRQNNPPALQGYPGGLDSVKLALNNFPSSFYDQIGKTRAAMGRHYSA
jgi:hypothetical protein